MQIKGNSIKESTFNGSFIKPHDEFSRRRGVPLYVHVSMRSGRGNKLWRNSC